MMKTLILIPVLAGVYAYPDTPDAFPGPVRLQLPGVIYATPGIETNIYFDNVVLVLNVKNYAFDVECRLGTHQVERWTFTPTPADVGDHPLQILVRNQQNELIAKAVTVVRVRPVNPMPNRTASLLCIGDSLTAGGVYTRKLLQHCESRKEFALKLIGCRGAGTNRHEGYGGWTAQRHATLSTERHRTGEKNGIGSPFIYKDGETSALNFKRYCEEFNDGKAPDYATLLLGCNDTFSSTDETIDDRINAMLKYYDTLIEMIHSLRSDTQIGALLLPPPAATQDAFGTNYKSSQTRWQYKRNQHRVVERMQEHFAGRKNVSLIPANLNLDCESNYPKSIASRNANSSTKVTRLANGVHPSAEGYYQIADSIYGWLASRLVKGD